MDSETFGVEKGYGTQAIEWMNEEAKKMGWKFEARLYNYEIQTKNFGSFEMFSLIGDPKAAREITMRASKRFKTSWLHSCGILSLMTFLRLQRLPGIGTTRLLPLVQPG